MSTDLEQQLRAALREDADRARLLNPDGPPEHHAIGNDHRRRNRRRLVAAAAVLALLAIAAIVTRVDDSEKVDTIAPATTTSSDTDPTPTPGTGPRPLPQPTVQRPGGRTIMSGSGCPFGIDGDPVDMRVGNDGRFDTEPGQGVAYIDLGTQTAEVRVPSFETTIEPVHPVEPVELGGRPGTVWLDGPTSGKQDLPFVQVRYDPVGTDPCRSFVVTVDGGTVEQNRATAIDVADRVLLPADLADLDLPGTEGGPVAGLELAGTTWAIDAAGPADGAEMTFTEDTVRWSDGCATVTADYELDRRTGTLTLANRESSDPGCTPPTNPEFEMGWPMIIEVMGHDEIDASFVNGHVYLGGYACQGCAVSSIIVLGPPR